MENVKLYASKFIKVVPGYRSGKKINKIIATVYYIICLLMLFSDVNSAIGGVVSPFIVVYGYEAYKKSKGNSPSKSIQRQQGELPIVRANIILQAGEMCHYAEQAVRLEPKTVTTGYTGGYAGVSFRVAKGVSLHTGGTSRKAIKENIMQKYQGQIYITNKRIVFVAQQKGFSMPLNKLVTVTLFSNAYQLHKDEVTYIIQPKKSRQFGQTLQSVINKYIGRGLIIFGGYYIKYLRSYMNEFIKDVIR